MSEDWSKHRAFREYAGHALAEMLPKLIDSAVCVSLAPSPEPGEPRGVGDVKYWVELGASIMLDKPIIVLAMPGQELPERLERVADKVIRADMRTEAGQKAAQEQLLVALAADERPDG
jgi:hypothetical protein